MPHTRETPINYNADADLFWVWLIWGVREFGRAPELIAIATTNEAKSRYLAAGSHGPFQRVHSERAWLDHMYGESLALNRVSRAATT